MEENTKEENQKQEKCFVMMPISDQGDYPAGHFTKVYEQIIQPAVREAGYEPYRVDENNICDTIINKIFDAIQECPMAICDLSNRNPNVLYELGLRQAYDKPVVLIQDEKTEKIFDVGGISTVFYKSARLYEDVIDARENIKNAILSTKEGKMNTLVRIVNARTPDLSKIEMSPDDKIQVMLDRIYNEIRQTNRGNVSNDENFTSNNVSNVNHTIDFFLQTLDEMERRINKSDDKKELSRLLAVCQVIQDDIKTSKFLSFTDTINLLERVKKYENLIQYKREGLD